MAVLSKAKVCGLLIAGILGSNPAEGFAFVVCCVGGGFCDGMVTCSEKCVCVCV